MNAAAKDIASTPPSVSAERTAQRTSDLEQANAALTRSEDYLRLAIDTIPSLVWTSLPDGHIEYLNKRWLEYTGLQLEEGTGWGWQAAVHPQDSPGLVEYWKTILATGEPGEYEARLRRHDGEYRWFLFRGVPLRDESGRVVKWYGTNTDVEARRASEHVARGQLDALTQTLDALARESEPEKFLDHVLRRIGQQLRAHSLGVWEINPATGGVELVANFEDDQVRHPAAGERPAPSPFQVPVEEHPVWTPFFRDGDRAVLGDLTTDPLRVRFADPPDSEWHDWHGAPVANPAVPVMQKRLSQAGVVASLAVPMSVAGQVTGLISIRFLEARPFRREEVELARALAHQATLAIRLVRLSRQSREAAVLAERNRMAREIHDTLAQGLTGVIVQLEAAEDAQAQGLAADAAAHVERASELARDGLREARRSVHALRPRALEDANLCAALNALFQKMSAGTGLEAAFHTEGQPRKLTAEVEENLLRVGQEVFTNVLRHARARHFTAWLMFDRDALRLEFCDDGCGFDRAGKGDGFGLIGMEERVREMGGRLDIQSVIGVGTAISILLALPDDSTSPNS